MKLETLDSKKSTFLDMLVKFQSQVRQTEEQIKVEFEELHQFLKEEEATRIAALREEEEEKSQRMKAKISEMNKLLTSVLEQINKIKDDMNNEDSLFLHKFRSTEERAKYTVPDPEVGPGVLIDVSKHLGNLRYTVWEKMKDICPY
ncbi:tripartite motif-containing protein 35-like isoform X2 [Electrophorus electricus]|nr:tripartite motif-containing protein 35-like isoform X2 [Electrophorus electricus]